MVIAMALDTERSYGTGATGPDITAPVYIVVRGRIGIFPNPQVVKTTLSDGYSSNAMMVTARYLLLQ